MIKRNILCEQGNLSSDCAPVGSKECRCRLGILLTGYVDVRLDFTFGYTNMQWCIVSSVTPQIKNLIVFQGKQFEEKRE